MATNYSATDAKNDLKDAARETAHDVKHGTEKLGQQARDTWNEASGDSATEKAKHIAGDAVDAAKEKGQDLMDSAREHGSEYADRARREADRLYRAGERKAGEVAHYAEDYYDEMTDMVRRKPAQSLGIAAGIGFLVGLILARR